jgi:hypothetical protein
MLEKMKRNYKLTIVAAALLAGITSCKKDFLEEKRDLSGVNEEVYKDSLEAQAYVDYVYGLFLPAANQPAPMWSLAGNGTTFGLLTEEAAGENNWNKVWANISYLNANCLSYFGTVPASGIGNNSWTRIKQINLFLDNIDKYGLPASTRAKLKGQMYFWRAWQYFDLVRLYGGVPLVLHSQPAVGAETNESLKVPRSTSSETIQQIYADLDSAVAMLPGRWTTLGDVDWGRITSGAALAVKGRVALTRATPVFNRNDDASRWQSAYDINKAAKKLLDDNQFGLAKTGTTTDGTAFENIFTKELNNPEGVIVFGFNNNQSDQVAKANGWEQSCRPKGWLGGNSQAATKQMMDAFPMKDGKPIGSSAYAYDLQKFYKNRDPRFYKTFAYNGQLWPYKENAKARVWTYKWFASTSEATPSSSTELTAPATSGVYVRKATSPSASNGLGNFSVNGEDYIELRYTEVLLNLAEAAAGIGNTGEAVSILETIRDRAGIEAANNHGLAGITGRDATIAAVLNERKIELAYEGKRFWDLRRWMLYDDTYGTCSRLNVAPLNDTRRTGLFVTVYKNKALLTKYVGKNDVDPFLKSQYTNTGTSTGTGTGNPYLDRDAANTYPPGVTTADQLVDYMYDNYFIVSEKDDLENSKVANWKFTWYKEYYFFGLPSSIINNSPYLDQTQGWDGLYGMGTFDPLK